MKYQLAVSVTESNGDPVDATGAGTLISVARVGVRLESGQAIEMQYSKANSAIIVWSCCRLIGAPHVQASSSQTYQSKLHGGSNGHRLALSTAEDSNLSFANHRAAGAGCAGRSVLL